MFIHKPPCMCFDPGNQADGKGNTIFAQTQIIPRNRYRQQSVKLLHDFTHYNRVFNQPQGNKDEQN